jgi:kynurenine formamidase
VIDVIREVAENPDFVLTSEHILAWEAEHGRIPAGAWVLLRTDWSKRSDPEAFLNVGEDGRIVLASTSRPRSSWPTSVMCWVSAQR